MGETTLAAIIKLLKKPFATTRYCNELCICSNEFITSSVDEEQMGSVVTANDLKLLLATLEEEDSSSNVECAVAKVLKIVLRCSENRQLLGKSGIAVIVNLLKRNIAKRSMEALLECCQIILNCCYDVENAQYFVDESGLQYLVVLVRSRDEKLLVGALGAIQVVCFIPSARQYLRNDRETLRRVCDLMNSLNSSVRNRATGVVHNLSVDLTSILVLRECDCLPSVVRLLKDSSKETCFAAIGTVQNLSRERASKQLLLQNGALNSLSDLILCGDISCQSSAVGAVLNLAGDGERTGEEGVEVPRLLMDKESLREHLVTCVTLGAIKSCLFDPIDKNDSG